MKAQPGETSDATDAGTEHAQPGAPSAPFQVLHSGNERWASRRPVCSRESLEAALYAIPSVGWWEVQDSSGRVVASNKIGILPGVGASLLARQILNTLPLSTDRARGSVGEIGTEMGAWSGTEDAAAPGGVRWTRLLETKDRPQTNGSAARKWVKGRPLRPPVSFETAPRPYHPAIEITIRHSTGWLRVLDHRYLELRAQPKPDRDGMPRWDLIVLSATASGEPGQTAKGTAVEGLGLEEFLELGTLGVGVREPRDPDAPPKTWRPGMVAARTNVESDDRTERPGWVRGCYGIDKRTCEIKVPMYGGGEWIDRRPRYHLTHLPSGYLVLHCKRRSTAERVADMLVEEVPELGKSAEVSEETGARVGELIQAMKDAAGWQWDR